MKTLSLASHPTQARVQLNLTVCIIFVGLGLQVGVWSVLLADLASALRLTTGALGVTLACMYVAGMLTVPAGGWLADRLGRRPVLLASMVGSGFFCVALGYVGSYAGLIAAVIVGGVFQVLYNLSMNTVGGDFERQYDTHALTTFHASFSASAAVGALMSGVLLDQGVSFSVVFIIAGVVLCLLAATVAYLPLPTHQPAGDEASSTPKDTARLLVPGVVMAALLVSFGFFADASLTGFSSVYLRSLLGSGALLGGVGIAVFNIAALVGRIASVMALGRIGTRNVLAAVGVVASLGMLIVLYTQQPAAAICGFLLIGMALAPVAPIAFSLTGRAVPQRAAQAASILASIGAFAYVVSPLLVGWVADLFELRTAFLLVLAATLAIIVLSRFVPVPPGGRS